MDAAVFGDRTSTPVRTRSVADRQPRRPETETAAGMSMAWAGEGPERKGLNGAIERVERARRRGSRLSRHPCAMVFSPR